ncbi:MAG: methyltransferase domain-containing protein [Candidatus Omnitrophota bacterium]
MKMKDRSISIPVRIVRCRKCGLVYTNPMPPFDRLVSDDVTLESGSYLEEERGARLGAKAILKKLKKFKKAQEKLLAIGFGVGFFMDEAKKSGWEVHGVEFSKPAVAFAKDKFGLENLIEGQFEPSIFPAKHFDFIMLKDILDHLEDPKKALIEIRRILKPSGVLYLNTPNIDSTISRLLKARWWGIKHAHIFYFTPRTLSKMLDATGFVHMASRPYVRAYSVKYWLEKIEFYNRGLYKVFSFLKRTNIALMILRVNLWDRVEVFARKSRKLEYLEEMEHPDVAVEKKRMKVVVVLPAYNAARTLGRTVADIPKNAIDEIILVDDHSSDDTVEAAHKLGLKVYVHEKNRGYGANQKTCYKKALESGADIAVMVHPDYQYDPRVIPELIEPILKGQADAVFGSRMMKRGALEGGMPVWKHNANILLTALENVVLGTYLTEYHSGFRAYSAKYLKSVSFMLDSDGFIFDTEIIVQGLLKNMRIEEVPIRTRYFDEASMIKFWPSVCYGFGILMTLAKYCLHHCGAWRIKQFS